MRTVTGMIPPPTRLQPPDDLTAEQRVIWTKMVGDVRPDWFTHENSPLLAQLCRHICSANKIEYDLQKLRRRRLTDSRTRFLFTELCKLMQAESRSIAALMTKLRLTPQSRFNYSDSTHKRRLGTSARIPRAGDVKSPVNNIDAPWAVAS
jgi:hypothetical protein